MSMRPHLLSRVLLLTIVKLSFAVASPLATTAQGNSPNAKLCQKDGWQVLVRADGTSFADQGACVSYGAQGGTIFPSVAVPCLAGGWATHARAGSPTVAFASEDECVAYAVSGGEIVDLVTVAPNGVLGLVFLRSIHPETNCSFTADLTEFPANTSITVEFWVRGGDTTGPTLDASVAVVTDGNGEAKVLGGHRWAHLTPEPYEVQARASNGPETAWIVLDC